MENPFSFSASKPVITIGRIFGTPLSMQGANWVPANQLVVWGLFTWRSIQKRTDWSGWQHFFFGGLKMAVLLGAEWCHNIAHTAAARAVGKPVDRMRIIFGMPVLLYDEPEHPSITPRQHILRSLAGPVCNFGLLLVSWFLRRFTPLGSPAREVADVAVGMNLFIALVALVPVPVLDGGPILKWSLIARGVPVAKVESAIDRTNQVIGAGLAGGAVIALQKRRWLLSLILAFLSTLSLVAGLGKMK